MSWIIFVISVIGNVTLIIALKHHFSRSSRLYICLMFNLATADLVFVVSSIPFNFVERLFAPRFPFGPVLCKLLMPFQTMAAMTAIFTLVTLSCQRYFMIVRPTEDTQDGRKVPLIITFLSLWLLPVILAAVPLAIALRYEDGKCGESWSDVYSKCFTVYLTMIQYVGPLGVIAWCNGRAVVALRRYERCLMVDNASFFFNIFFLQCVSRMVPSPSIYVSTFFVAPLFHFDNNVLYSSSSFPSF